MPNSFIYSQVVSLLNCFELVSRERAVIKTGPKFLISPVYQICDYSITIKNLSHRLPKSWSVISLISGADLPFRQLGLRTPFLCLVVLLICFPAFFRNDIIVSVNLAIQIYLSVITLFEEKVQQVVAAS